MPSDSRYRHQSSLRSPGYYRPSNGSRDYDSDYYEPPRDDSRDRYKSTQRGVYDDDNGYVERGYRRHSDEHEGSYQVYEEYEDSYYPQDPCTDYEYNRRPTYRDKRQDSYDHGRYGRRPSYSDLDEWSIPPFSHGTRRPNASSGHEGHCESQSTRHRSSLPTIITKASGGGDDDIPPHVLDQLPQGEGYEFNYSEQTREGTLYVFEKNRDKPGQQQGYSVFDKAK